MSEVLSQQEIDQLLSGINSGEIKEERLGEYKKGHEVYEYDFRRPNRVSKDQLKTIRTLHESFSEIFGFYLASKLQTMATIDLIAVDQLRYSEYVLSINNPSCIFIFDIKETEGRAILESTPEMVLAIVDRLLGGSGTKVEVKRGITPIEQRLIRPIINQALKNLSTAWNPVQHLNFSLSDFESNPDFVQIAPASEIVIIISFQIKIGEDSYLMNLCYPSFALDEVIARLNIQYYSTLQMSKDKHQTRENISRQLAQTRLPLRATLGTTRISVSDLLHLEEGDVLVLDNSVDDDLPVYVDKRLKFRGRPGVSNEHIALKITDVIDQEI